MCADVKSCSEELVMSIETILGLAASALLLVYLAYALLRPEKF
jgi:K+-transporting ATPase KdpF subunit